MLNSGQAERENMYYIPASLSNTSVWHSNIMTALRTVLYSCRDLSRFSQGWYRLTFLTTPLSQAFTSHTAWDAYLCQEQLTQGEIMRSLTHKGQADHSVTKLSCSCPAIHSPHPSPPSNTLLQCCVIFCSLFAVTHFTF